MSYDLDPFLNGPTIPPGRSTYTPEKFAPKKAHHRRHVMDDNPYDQTVSGNRSFRATRDDDEERVRPFGNLPDFLVPERHQVLVRHPQYETFCRADGKKEFYTLSPGEIKCTEGDSHGKYKQPYEEKPEGEAPMDWPQDMVDALGISDDNRGPLQPPSDDLSWLD